VIRGSLKNLPLTDMFQLIANTQKSGVMTLTRHESRARLYFELGRLSYAHVTPGNHLGEIMVRMDLLSFHEVQEILRRQRTENPGTLLGRMAVDMGYIEEDDLAAAVELQALEVLSELMSWDDGAFEFTAPDTGSTQTPVGEGIDALALLMRVAHGMYEYSDAAGPELVFLKAGDPTSVEMPQGGWEVLGHVDGRRSARSIAAELDMSERKVFHLLARLAELGVLEQAPYSADEPLILVVTPSAALARLLRLTLLRAGLRVELVEDYADALHGIEEHHPKAVVMDDAAGAAWDVVREVRRSGAHGHLPVLLLVDQPPRQNLFRPLPRAEHMLKPFHEIELQQEVGRLLGKSFGTGRKTPT